MNYHNILHDNMLNGSGLRVVLFLSGCTHHCPGCQNPQTHDFNSGIRFTSSELQEIIEQLSKPYIKGLTITGGDPLHEYNVKEVNNLCKTIKNLFPDKDIWVYTGYNFEDLPTEYLKYIDVLADGRYVDSLKDVNLPYVGSSNQRLINVKETIKNQKIILLQT